MGLMRFIISPPNRITEEMLQLTYLSGLDRVPWQVRAERRNGELWLERAGSDSGNLHIPWPVPGWGQLMLSTATLRERPEPYYLPLDLARGKIGQVRNQLADWAALGMDVPAAVRQKLDEALRLFGKAAVIGYASPRSSPLAERALTSGVEAGAMLVAAYTEQALAVRRRLADGAKLGAFLGANLGTSPLDEATAAQCDAPFNSANVPIVWREVETSEGRYSWDVCDRQIQWCRAQGLTVSVGPLLLFDEQSIPDWLHVCEGDFEGILEFASEFLQAAVDRYHGQVDFWQCAGRGNSADILSLSEEEQVRLTARSIELIRARDPKTPIVASFDQPWAEYLGRRPKDFPPLQFADALLRAGLGLTGIALEINLGYLPDGTFPRDPLDFSQQLDYWSLLGVPLYLSLTYPSNATADPLAQQRTSQPEGDWSPAGQQAWIRRYVSLMLAKPPVQGVLWNQLRDAEPHAFAHGGLFDLRRQPKPALRELAALRQMHLR